MAFKWSCDVFLCYNLFSSSLYVCLFLKKEEDNCLILLKRECCVQYNLFYSPLKVTVAFEWSYSIPLCQNLFSSLLCVCFVSRRKKNAQLKAIDNHIIIFSQDLGNNNVLKNQQGIFISGVQSISPLPGSKVQSNSNHLYSKQINFHCSYIQNHI